MRKQWWLGGVAVAVLAGGAGVYATSGSSAPAAKKDAAKPALEFQAGEVIKPTMAPMPGLIEFSGPLVAPNTVIVRAKASGSLDRLTVGEGSRVKAGQSLGQLDLEELRHKVAERNASVESARAMYEQSERQYKANQGLASQNFIAPTALDNSRAQLESARGQMLSAQAQLGTSEVLLRQAALISPIDGIVAKRHTLPGEKVAAEQQVLTIVDLSKLELAGLVGTHEVGKLSPGMTVQVKVEGSDEPVTARIARIAPAAEPGTRSIGVTLTLDNTGERFRAGQYAVARVELPDDKPRLTVPSTAVGAVSGQEHVWLIEKGMLVRRIVTTGRRDPREGRVEILAGVTPQSQVLGARFDNLKEGERAEIRAPKASMASVAASGATAQ
ncbi:MULTISPECIES: efflux RND transporter periplasmic adaptor subunit [unclassified Roseateles]|nr:MULTISPECIES: efflux RND transporter periplasmic adaptor subunit [unclassified Roseateles]MBB3281554.1 RND family efflux transporter MFP subunit [Mitsuaria sp. BK037]MBB3293605.1 RND family efflux transporter MFP subunit [Mitsuaria sp. BK041]MBB3362822.1 RND family efflux transporter MFP subunit [Mitsuaria sp. BK045]